VEEKKTMKICLKQGHVYHPGKSPFL